MNIIPAEIIKKKRDGQELSEAELSSFLLEYLKEKISDYQMTSFLMAIFFKGLSRKELSVFTSIMKNSGKTLSLKTNRPIIDKHSSGGVGDKVSIILGPLCAAGGLTIPMISGRGLGHTGGTLDKLDSLSGFNSQLSFKEIVSNLEKHSIVITGQTPEICPLDKKLYALRDVSGIVESIPLICASIMSKKLSENLDGLLLDIKCGNGAFMKTKMEAMILAHKLKTIGEDNGVKTKALISNMNQPLGCAIGNSLEIQECLNILNGETKIINEIDLYEDLLQLTLTQASEMFVLGKICKNSKEGLEYAKNIIQKKLALNKFKELVKAQGGQLSLPVADFQKNIKAPKSGYIQDIKTLDLGLLSIKLGAGRLVKEDIIDYSAGIECFIKKGMKVNQGDIIFKIHTSNFKHKIKEVSQEIYSCFKISREKINPDPLILKSF